MSNLGIRRAGCSLFVATALAGVLTAENHAKACAAVLTETIPGATETLKVQDHRIAFSISKQRTILWDQVHYTGSPTGFAWVVPVKTGAVVELSRDAWMDALDSSTSTTITRPAITIDHASGEGCNVPSPGCSSAVGGELGGESTKEEATVVRQSIVGPYETVTLRSTSPEAVFEWLRAHDYAVDARARSVIGQFVAEGFDFLAMRLQPGRDVQSMRPVRLVTPGADPTLPLRMIAVGAGESVGLTVFVLSEGRYHPKNFPDAVVDFTQLRWPEGSSASNYRALASAALAKDDGRGWLTEYSDSGTDQIAASYYQSKCLGPSGPGDAGKGDAGQRDGGVRDASVDASDLDADVGDAGDIDATVGDAGTKGFDDCRKDDLEKAIEGMTGPVWVTRLRANLPVAALGKDLVLEATAEQVPVSASHTVPSSDAPKASVSPRPAHVAGSWLVLGSTLAFLGYRLRRRSKR